MSKVDFLFNLIKNAICKYILVPLKCTREDVMLLAINLDLLIKLNNLDYNEWYIIFKRYLKIEGSSELNNLICYVKNRL